MSKRQRKNLLRILVCSFLFALCFVVGFYFPKNEFYFFFGLFVLIGADVLFDAVRNIFRGQVFDENFLMSIASVGAVILGDLPEAVAVMLFYKVGSFFESFAVERSRKSISSLMDIRPDWANVEREDGIIEVSPEEVNIGEIILVRVGEKIPLDGVVTEGTSSLDTSALTGESIPKDVSTGDSVISGCINLSGVIKIRVTSEFSASTAQRILELVENSALNKSKSESFISRFAKVYTPAVCILAAIIAIIPSVITNSWAVWVNRALVFLVVSCPCALVISVPLSFFSGIGGASKRGILIKGATYLERLAKTDTFVFDKTGTLTKGDFSVTDVKGDDRVLYFSAHAECYSSHPIVGAIKRAYGKEIDADRVKNVKEFAGMGVSAEVDGKRVLVGNKKLMGGLSCPKADKVGTHTFVAVENEVIGVITVADSIKEEGRGVLKSLRQAGAKKLVMLTGDKEEIAQSVAKELKLDLVKSELLPEDKVNAFGEIEGVKAFVGDGVNDAPVLALADVGISMGALGTDAAIEASDIVLMNDRLSSISTAVKISKKTLSVVKQNIVFSLAVKFGIMLLSMFGLIDAWALYLAVFADVGVSVICILNAMRCMKIKSKRS